MPDQTEVKGHTNDPGHPGTPGPAGVEVKPESKKVQPNTVYVVLVSKQHAGESTWSPIAELNTRSASAAVRMAAEKNGEGTYVAVPFRSWQPVTVKVETKTQLKFS